MLVDLPSSVNRDTPTKALSRNLFLLGRKYQVVFRNNVCKIISTYI
jgi:hypothetical protein